MSLSRLVNLLSDGHFHSGESMAQHLGLSRTAVWKYVQELRSMGVDVFSVSGKGYKLPEGIELLSESHICEQLTKAYPNLYALQVYQSIASTNQALQAIPLSKKFHFCLSEYQSMGRGRQGKSWHSPFARNIYLSVKTRFSKSAKELSGLSVAVGVMIASLLESIGVSSVGLKWPNDLKIGKAKLGGILVELTRPQDSEVVIGIGINWSMPSLSDVGQDWCNLSPMLPQINRNQMVVNLCSALISGLRQFDDEGLTPFLTQWPRYDCLLQKQVNVIRGQRVTAGMAKGIDKTGAILIEVDGTVQPFYGGEISLRVIDDVTG